MIYTASGIAVGTFLFFVALVLGISFYLGSKAKSSAGYFAAHGEVHWAVNGIAFAGDYLSAASFLGICGMIAFYGYDGFLYSIGFLAGWIVALFVVAEPLKKLGKYTFASAVDSLYDSRGVKLSAGISTLVVSIFYLIPQMVGAGALIKPLLGFSYPVGVVGVGVIVILIVTTAGMVSTTWVQFIKGSLLVIFCSIITVWILQRGFTVDTKTTLPSEQTVEVITANGTATKLVNGAKQGTKPGEHDLLSVGRVVELPDGATSTGPLGPLEFFRVLSKSKVQLWKPDPKKTEMREDGSKSELITYKPRVISGADALLPGQSPTFAGLLKDKLAAKLDFISLMLALFCGTASLPHILIRYYTVKDQSSVRKSTVVGIASIGFFYILTLYLGLGAMTSGAMDPTDTNMSAPLLARTFGEFPFAIISAVAFTTVLGTVSGLIIASSGAVVHDLIENFSSKPIADDKKVIYGKISSIVVGAIAILLGIVFQKFNVSFLVGWAFNIAASANLPALLMLLFWKRTTKYGITASILVGMCSSLGWVLMSKEAYQHLWSLDPANAPVPFSQPGIVTIPLSFAVLIIVSLFTKKREDRIDGIPAEA